MKPSQINFDDLLVIINSDDKEFVQHLKEIINREYNLRKNKLRRDAIPKTHRCTGIPSFWIGETLTFVKDRITNGRVCDSCGSIHPEDLITILNKKGTSAIEFSEKNYKWYINRNQFKFYRKHDTKELIDLVNNLIKST